MPGRQPEVRSLCLAPSVAPLAALAAAGGRKAAEAATARKVWFIKSNQIKSNQIKSNQIKYN
jgi:hypothetical protein